VGATLASKSAHNLENVTLANLTINQTSAVEMRRGETGLQKVLSIASCMYLWHTEAEQVFYEGPDSIFNSSDRSKDLRLDIRG
jgi:hypothetical protein